VCAGVLIANLIGMPMIKKVEEKENPVHNCLAYPL
jgi:hypothetical protein